LLILKTYDINHLEDEERNASHLKLRLKIRNIPYYDSLTQHYIAVSKLKYREKIREFALAYDKKEGIIEIVTIHPLKAYQKLSRINSGRWQRI